jgi:ubiquinone/menaquinone biosynthesis C-methylase UbiE
MDGSTEARRPGTEANPSTDALPDYLVKTYWWAYLNPTSLHVFDNPIVAPAILWGNMARLVKAACDEFEPGQRLLQAASAYGPISARLASTVGETGFLEVIDIARIQVEHCRRKLGNQAHTRVRIADAADPGGGPYDGVCCFFLLHEVPDENKHAIVNALLESVKPGGKLVFIDYHAPHTWHPLRGVMSMVFQFLEPYAEGLIRRQIQDFAVDSSQYTWRKETYFGELYQKVVVEKAAGPEVETRSTDG